MAITDMACHSTGQPISLQQIADRQNIDLNYLEQIFVGLRRNKIVTSSKGPGGGYMLSRDIKDIKIADILHAVDDSFKMTRCSGTEGCSYKGAKCLTHNLWAGLEENIASYLNSISLYDVTKNFNKI